MTDLPIAHRILEQLGGPRFVMMTGARHLIGETNSLRFRYGAGLKTTDGSSLMVIRLNAFDTYDIETLYVRGGNTRVCSYVEGVYADHLRATFTRLTGLDTSLGTMGVRP